jgi:hypothetical protein
MTHDAHELDALLEAGAAAGEYLDAIGQTDLAELDSEQWREFLRQLLTNYGRALRCRILADEHTEPDDDRDQYLEEIRQLINANGFTARDFFLTQPPGPDPKDKPARARWQARERRRNLIVQRMARYGLTVHDLAPPEMKRGVDGTV